MPEELKKQTPCGNDRKKGNGKEKQRANALAFL
jgi:hypothetical protein